MSAPPTKTFSSRGRVAMIVWNTFDSDARVQKEIATLIAAGWEVHVFCRRADPHGPASEWRGPGLVVERFPRKPGGDTLGAADFVSQPARRSRAAQMLHMSRQLLLQQQMVRAMAAIKPMIIHAHDLNTLIPAWQAARRASVPLIYDAHEFNMDRIDQNNWLRPISRRIEDFALRRAAGVIVPSPMIAKALARFYRVRRPAVIGNWPIYNPDLRADKNGLRERLGISSARPIALYQGGLQPHRGLDLLVEAMVEVQSLDLVIMGDGRLRNSLMAHISELGLSDRVHMLPPEPLDNLLALTMTADIGVHALEAGCLNHAYASPNKLFEYFHAGLPVIMTDLPEVRSIFRKAPDGSPGLLFRPGDKEALVFALEKLSGDSALRSTLADRARRASQQFCWQAQEQVLLEAYATATKGMPLLF